MEQALGSGFDPKLSTALQQDKWTNKTKKSNVAHLVWGFSFPFVLEFISKAGRAPKEDIWCSKICSCVGMGQILQTFLHTKSIHAGIAAHEATSVPTYLAELETYNQ